MRSSTSPGCSPTTNRRALRGPSPNTVCVPTFHRPQPRQWVAAARSLDSVAFGGMKSAAELVVLAVFFRFIVLLAVLVEPVAAWSWLTVRVYVGFCSRCLTRLVVDEAAASLEERGVGLGPVLALGMRL